MKEEYKITVSSFLFAFSPRRSFIMANKAKPYSKQHVYKNFARRIGSTQKESEQILSHFFDMIRDYIDEYGIFHYKDEIKIEAKSIEEHTKLLPTGQLYTIAAKRKLQLKLMQNFNK